MTKSEWLERANKNADKLRSLICNYHPGIARGPKLPITAQRAEVACASVRSKYAHIKDAETQFDVALKEGDVGKVSSLLNQAWFGVPESTSCWGIEGFSEAVDLLDDPPEEDE